MPRITLRPYRPDDRDAFLHLMTDPVVTEHLDGPMPVERAHAIFDLASGVPGAADVPRVALALAAEEGGRMVGHGALLREDDLGRYLPAPPSRPLLGVGYVLPVSSWGRGIATEIARGLVTLGRERFPEAMLVATVDSDHPASIRVLEKAGATHIVTVPEDGDSFELYAWPRDRA